MSDGTTSDLRCLREQGIHLCKPERERPHALQHRHHPAGAGIPGKIRQPHPVDHHCGKGIPVGYAVRRIWEGGHGTRSQHYAGVSFDVGQSLTQTARTAIYNAARGTGAWGYVEPLSQTPTWVHMDRRYGTPACSGTTAGYPTLRRGSRGCYVMILQDALSTLGYQTGSRIDGIFGARTEEALKGFQRRTSLRVDGVCGCNSWKKISTAVIGVGRTKTTID